MKNAANAKAADPAVMVQDAIGKLREARDLLNAAGATRAVEKVRSALKSAEGAERHATCLAARSGAGSMVTNESEAIA
ncbi:MAG: hypothetical protein AzoDbin1_04236 [Azoarcus sp.]|nr:hypothetical protein [Azoarcus sp.]